MLVLELMHAIPVTAEQVLAKAFEPTIKQVQGGRPAFSLLQLYRCMVLPLCL